jgi:hypothetical protein
MYANHKFVQYADNSEDPWDKTDVAAAELALHTLDASLRMPNISSSSWRDLISLFNMIPGMFATAVTNRIKVSFLSTWQLHMYLM